MRKLVTFFISLILLSFMVFSVSADTVYVGNINSSALTYLGDVIYNNPLEDYVIYRVGEYETKLVYGDLVYENNTITAKGEINVVIYNQRGGSDGGYSYYPTVNYNTADSFTLTINNSSLIYSNLGDFASVERESHLGDYLHYGIEFFALVTLFLSFFIFNRGKIHL